MKVGKIRTIINDYFYVMFMILAFLAFIDIIPNSIRTIIWVLLVFFNAKFVSFRNNNDFLILVFIVLELLSIIGFIVVPYPTEDLFTALFYQTIPILFYFIGEKTTIKEADSFYIHTVCACFFCFVVGFYLYITMPDWFITKQLDEARMVGKYTAETVQYAKFGSFLGPYPVGNLGVFSLCCSLVLYDKIKTESPILSRFLLAASVVAFIAIVLCRQRVSMFVGIFLVLYYFYNRKGRAFLSIIGLFLVVVVPFYFIMKYADETLSIEIISRFTEDSSASSLMEGRGSSWAYALANQRDFIFGHGIGGGGHLATAHNIKPTINDCTYLLVLLERGMFSFLLLIFMIGYGLKKAFRYAKVLRIEFMVIFFYACSMIGADIIEFPYIMPPFWFCLGRVYAFKPILNIEQNLIK